MMDSSPGPRSRSREKLASGIGSPDRAPLVDVSIRGEFDSPMPQTPRSPRSPRRVHGSGLIRRGLVCSILVVAATVVVCLYVDKENLLRLGERSNSLIRKKKGENLSPSRPPVLDETDRNDHGHVDIVEVGQEMTENVGVGGGYSNEMQPDTIVQVEEAISEEYVIEKSGNEDAEHETEQTGNGEVESVENQPEIYVEEQTATSEELVHEEDIELDGLRTEGAPAIIVHEEEQAAPDTDEEEEQDAVVSEMTPTDVGVKAEEITNTAVAEQDNEASVPQVVDERLNLVLHVGPQKTGSTTLQEAWSSSVELMNPLLEDHYSYHFINPHRGYFDCEVISGAYVDCKATAMIKNAISEAKNNHNHLLLSEENLDQRFVGPLREVINDDDWNVKVVVVYRRIHEWLVSWYNQINKTTNKDASGNFLIDEHGNPYRTEHIHWPQDGGQHVRTFTSWYKVFTEYFDKSDLISHHNSISFMRWYKEAFDNVYVYNMHEGGGLVTNFMCDVVPDATNCCNQLRDGTVKVPRANGSVNLDYDIIAVEAKERGLLMNSLSRQEVTKAVTTFVEQFAPTIPRRCDSDVIDEIRHWLLDSEAYMFSDSWTDKKTDGLVQVFESYLGKGLLCDVDLEAVFADTNWISFFKALHNTASGKLKNHLVLHVGPQKTGSSTLQAAWDIMRFNALDMDNYNYNHITPENHDFSCDVGPWGGFKSCKASEQLKNLISSSVKARRNLLLSDENLDGRFAPALREVIDDDQWNVSVVVVYRRIHEWLVSWYNQIHKTTNLDSKGNVLIDRNGIPYREEHRYWPSQGGERVPVFSEWYTGFVHYWDPTKLVEKHRSVELYNTYRTLFDDVIVYDMHADGDLVTNFMCDIIPQADHSCLQLQRHQITLPTVNPSVNLDYDILAVSAYEQGYIKAKISRKDAVAAVANYIKTKGKKLPQKCDDNIVNDIYAWLEGSEKVMFADQWTEERSLAMNESFQTDLAKGTLCDVDVEEVLRDEQWINFFKSLGNK